MHEQGYTQTDRQDLNSTALERKNFAASPGASRYYRDQYTAVQPNQGGSSTMKTTEHLEYKQLDRRMTMRSGGVYRYPLPRALFQRFSFQRHLDAGSRSTCQNHSIKSSLLTCLTRVQRKPHPQLGQLATNLLTFFCVFTLHCLAE